MFYFIKKKLKSVFNRLCVLYLTQNTPQKSDKTKILRDMEAKNCKIILRSIEPKTWKFFSDVYFRMAPITRLTKSFLHLRLLHQMRYHCLERKIAAFWNSYVEWPHLHFSLAWGRVHTCVYATDNRLHSAMAKKDFLHTLLIWPHACNLHMSFQKLL